MVVRFVHERVAARATAGRLTPAAARPARLT